MMKHNRTKNQMCQNDTNITRKQMCQNNTVQTEQGTNCVIMIQNIKRNQMRQRQNVLTTAEH